MGGGRRAIVAALLASGLASGGLAGCGSDDEAKTPHVARTISVPGDYDTIQDAVDAAGVGDTIEVGPGTYQEAVRIDVDGLTLRGLDRNKVVLDGGSLDGNGVTVTAPDVVVENLTVQNFTQNGVIVTGDTENGGIGHNSPGYQTLDPEKFPPVVGFAVRYVTAINNGLYGIYAFDSNDGVIEQSYASGHPDSGFYVGQCERCDIVVRDNVAERNAVGYEQANASDSVVVVGNRFVGNRVGLTVLSDHQEAFVPNRKATVVGNLVSDNNQVDTPHQADGGFGIGIGLAGAVEATIARNRVDGNETAGIALSSSADLPPSGNRVTGNHATGNGTDLWFASSAAAPGEGNCFEDNDAHTSKPSPLPDGWSCSGEGSTGAGVALVMARDPKGIPFFEVAAPPAQPQMPEDAATGPGSVDVDLDAVAVPSADLFAARSGLS